MRQDCLIQQIAVNVLLASGAAWKFKVFRWNAGTSLYDFVAQQSFTPVNGANTITIAPPIAAQVGDLVGVFLPGSTNENKRYSSHSNNIGEVYTAGDISASNAFASAVPTTDGELDVLGYAPYLAVTGDSISEGHGGAAAWHSGLHDTAAQTLPGGEPTSEPTNQLRDLIGNGSVLEYHNLSLGSQTFAWVAATGVPACILVKPHTILIHCGVNDIATGRTWANVLANLATILAAVNAASPVPQLLIDEILPWTAGSDAQAATVRAFNANLAAWCAANGAKLVSCHDQMGQVRPATGKLDDLLTAYDQDGVHPTAAGVNALADIWRRHL